MQQLKRNPNAKLDWITKCEMSNLSEPRRQYRLVVSYARAPVKFRTYLPYAMRKKLAGKFGDIRRRC
jgi:hypothetical protein